MLHISCPSDHAALLFLFSLHCYPLGNLKFKAEGDWEPTPALRVKSGNHCPSFKLCWCSEDENLAFCTVVNRGKIESL